MLGDSIPFKVPHALSVSLPTWRDTVGWAEGDSTIVDQMSTGYPRFFIHRTIQKVLVAYLFAHVLTFALA
jgi:cystathionine gamma-synthase